MVPGRPHAQHIHGDSSLERDFTCRPRMRTPTVTASSTRWRESSYGEIHIALTTQGDATPASGPAIDRFPVAGADGALTYERTFTAAELPDGTATAVRNLHVVTHGIDVNGNGEYDMAGGPSELDPALPQEATAPASCGIIEGSNISTIPAGGSTRVSGRSPAQATEPSPAHRCSVLGDRRYRRAVGDRHGPVPSADRSPVRTRWLIPFVLAPALCLAGCAGADEELISRDVRGSQGSPRTRPPPCRSAQRLAVTCTDGPGWFAVE